MDSLIGHQDLVTKLADANAAGTLAHALLFVGPQSVGKTTSGQTLATEVLGDWPGGIMAHPDYWIEDSDTERISIEAVRKSDDFIGLQEFFATKAYTGKNKIAIVARAERLTEQAANSILKILEEPPGGSLIILTTAFPEALPATIRSRCQTFTLAPVSTEQITKWLTEVQQIDKVDASAAAALSLGRPGRAYELATDKSKLEQETAAIETFIGLPGKGKVELFQAAAQLAPSSSAAGREQALLQLVTWTTFLQDVARTAANESVITWEMYRTVIEQWSKQMSLTQITKAMDRCVNTAEQIATYANPRLAYEVLLLDIFSVVAAAS